MMKYVFPLVFCLGVLSAGSYLALERPPWLPVYGESEKVLVFLVGSDAGVDRLRRSVDPARILVSSNDAITLSEGRIVAANVAAVGPQLTAAGWVEREIELLHLEKADRLNRRAAGEAGQGGEASEERLARLRELVSKPTLSAGEQMFVLQAMNDGVQF